MKIPSVPTIKKNVSKYKDPIRRLRYLNELLLELDGQIAENTSTFNELMEAGELVDPVEPQLLIERLQRTRAYVMDRIDLLTEELTGRSQVNPKTATGSPLVVHEPDEARTEADDDLLTIQELGNLLGKSRSTIYKWVSAKKIPCVKVGRSDMFRRSDVKQWIEEQARRSI